MSLSLIRDIFSLAIQNEILFSDPDSIVGCLLSLETFCEKTLQIDYSPWRFVKLCDYENIYCEMVKSYKTVKIASDVESSSSISEPVFVPEKLPEQRLCPAQRPRVDVEKTQHAASAASLVNQLRSNRKPSGAESS